MSVFLKFMAAILLGGLLGVFGVAGFLLNQPPGNPSTVRLVDIPPGTTFNQVAHLLYDQRLIRAKWVFSILGRFQNLDRKIFPGEYEFHAGMSTMEVLDKLAKGELVQHAVTIPEGYSVAQIAGVLSQKGLAKIDEVLQLNEDQLFIRSLHLSVPTLEGYLFPDTYQFARYTPADAILKAMVSRFQEVVTTDIRNQAAKMGMTLQELLTLASVVEKETGLPVERPLVAGVFHNRLKKNIPLQSDPTVIYAIENFDGNIRKADLSINSPYNTYRVRGLPPGPIANPGLDAIKAVLDPTPTDFVYFVSRNDGSHEFSATLDEHNRAVEKYQRKGKAKQAS
ncbi:MAG: endolytic transglycosylase MltG [Nitrospirales bacterium]